MKRFSYSGIALAVILGLPAFFACAESQAQSSSQSSEGSSLGDYAKQARKSEPRGKARMFDNDNLPKDDKLSIVGSAANSSSDNSPAATQEPAASSASTEVKASEGKASPEGKAAAKTEGATQTTSQTQPGEAQTGQTQTGQTQTGQTQTGQTQTGQAQAGQAQTGQPQPATEEKPTAGTPKPIDQEQAEKEAKWKEWGDKLDSQKDQISLLTRELDVAQREYQLRAAAMYGDAGNRMRNQTDWDKQDAQYKQQIADKQKAIDDAKQKLDDMQEDARKAGVPTSIREP